MLMGTIDNLRTPYLLIGGEMEEHINNVIAVNAAVQDVWRKYKNEVGAERLYAGNRVVGATFPDCGVPDGWIHRQKDPRCVVIPKARTVLREQFDQLPRMLTAYEFNEGISCPIVTVGNRQLFASFELYGDRMVVWIPSGALDMGYEPLKEMQELTKSEINELITLQSGVDIITN